MNHPFKLILALLLFAGAAALSWAQPTESGVNITNQASATFTDTNGADRSTLSNTVTTVVQTVYSFNVEPDASGTVAQTQPGSSVNTGDGTATDPTAVTDNDFASGAFASNDLDAAASDTVLFTYTLENQSNVDDVVFSIAVVESDADNILGTYVIYVDDDPDAADSADANTNGTADGTPDGIPDNYIIASTITLPISDGTAGSGTDFTNIYVKATVDAAATGNEVALIDLQVTNTTAAAEVVATTYTPTANANELYENNNLGRVEIDEITTIGVAKEATSITNNADGTYTIVYTMNVENFGNVTLSNVQITEDLATRFGTYVASIGDVDAAGEYFVTVGTPTGLTANGGFTGSGANMSLLDASSSSLTAGGTGSIAITVTVYPSTLGTVNNQVTVAATSPDGATPSDTSTNGNDPDADGDNGDGTVDGDNTPDENDPTPVTLAQTPSIGLAKQAGTVVDNSDGTFTVPFTITVENLGNMNLHDVQVTDALTAEFGTFGAGVPTAAGNYTLNDMNLGTGGTQTLAVTDATAGTSFAVNSSYDGSGTTTLLDLSSGAVLETGQSITLSLSVRFYPDFDQAPFLNQAFGTGDLPSNSDGIADNDTEDYSNDGTDTDSDNDGLGNEQDTDYDANNDETTASNEGDVNDAGTTGDGTTVDDNTPTTVTLPTDGVIGVAKEAGTIVDNEDGTFTVPFTVTVENLGNVDLYDVTVTDNLTAEFGTYGTSAPTAAGNYSLTDVDGGTPGVQAVTVAGTATGFTADPSFTGEVANSNLITLSSSTPLEVGETIVLTFEMTFYPDFAQSPFTNQASASGDEPDADGDGDGTADGDTTDTSDNGTDPDPDGEGDPDEAGENDPTPVTITQDPVIGAAKQAGTIVDHGDGTFSVPFTVAIENLGNVDLYDVSITDSLTAEFGTNVATVGEVDTAGEYTISVAPAIAGGTATGFSANAGFNGSGDTNLIDIEENVAFEADETLIVTFTMRFYPDFSLAPFTNQATATGDSPDAGGNGDGTADGDTSDTSDSGTEPDTDGDDNPDEPGENDPTPVTPTEDAVIGAAKEVISSVNNGDGTYTITYDIHLENFGNVILSSIQVTEDLATTFTAADSFTVDSLTVTSGGLTRNQTGGGVLEFNGDADTNLLDEANAANSLAVGATATLRLVVTVTPGAMTGSSETYNNSVTAYGYSPTDEADVGTDKSTPSTTASTSDTSTNSDDPDVDAVESDGTTDDTSTGANDGNDDPSDNTSVTPVTVTEAPVIGVAKNATISNYDADSNAATEGPFEITFDFYLENLGDVDVSSVTLIDSLAGFGTYAGTTVGSLTLGDATTEYVVTSVTEIADSGSTVTVNGAFTGAGANTNILGTSSLETGETAQVRVVIVVDDTGSYTNSATVNGTGPGGTTTSDDSDDGTDPNGDGDTDPGEPGEDDDTPVTITSSNLDVVKTQRLCDDALCVGDTTLFVDTQLDAEPGEFIQYQIVATGSTALTNVKVFDNLPTGTNYSTGTLSVTHTSDGTLVYSTDGTTFSGTLPTVNATGFYVGVNTDGDATTISGTDEFETAAGAAASLTITFIVEIP